MKKLNFLNDYSEIGCPQVIDKINELVYEKNYPYMNDYHTKNAIDLIRKKIKNKNAVVQFFMTGTQTNLVAAAAFLRPHEAIICVSDAHINVHETGSIESTGHKCIAVDRFDCKIRPNDIEEICGPSYWDNAGILCVKPKMVYISQTTEVGTHYTNKELENLRMVCDKYNLYLYCDGARLGSSLACSDVSLEDLAKYCDAFYIGGTKNGAMFGEAMVILNDNLKEDIGFIAKQNGAVLSKGWLISYQFEALFENGLYEKNGIHSNRMADMLRKQLVDLSLKFYIKNESNQIFVIMENKEIDKLKRYVLFDIIKNYDDSHKVIRFVTSWATSKEMVSELIETIRRIQID